MCDLWKWGTGRRVWTLCLSTHTAASCPAPDFSGAQCTDAMRWALLPLCVWGVGVAAAAAATSAPAAAASVAESGESPEWRVAAGIGSAAWPALLEPTFDTESFGEGPASAGGVKNGGGAAAVQGPLSRTQQRRPTREAQLPVFEESAWAQGEPQRSSAAVAPLEAASLISALVGANLQRALHRKIESVQARRRREVKLARIQLFFSTFFILHTLFMTYTLAEQSRTEGIGTVLSFNFLLTVICISMLPDYFMDGRYLRYLRLAFSSSKGQLSEEEIAEMSAAMHSQLLQLLIHTREQAAGRPPPSAAAWTWSPSSSDDAAPPARGSVSAKAFPAAQQPLNAGGSSAVPSNATAAEGALNQPLPDMI